MIDPSSSEVVFVDLKNSYSEILVSRRYPTRFRRAFDEYVYRSQQLTEVMRREYSREVGAQWNASSFPYWNAYTDMLKAVRRATYHGIPLVLHEYTLSVYPAVEFATDHKEIGQRQIKAGVRLIETTSFVDMPFSELLTTPRIGFPRKSIGSKSPFDTHIFPIKEFVSYKLQWNLLENGVRAASNRAGTTDVVRIVLRSFPILEKYYGFYRENLLLARPNRFEL